MNVAPSSPAPGWFRRHFDADYRVLYSGRTQAQADREVDFVVSALGVSADETVIDLCCGYGRHLRRFRERGLRVVGVDLSTALLAQIPASLGAERVCADMRQLPFAGGDAGFPVLVNFFTSFGYFEEDEENERAAREIARVLRPGGRFLIDLMNPDAVVPKLVPHNERSAGPFHVEERRWYDAERRRVEKRIRATDSRSDAVKEYTESVRVYRSEEARDLLTRAGLTVDAIYGDLDGGAPSADAPRLALVGRRE